MLNSWSYNEHEDRVIKLQLCDSANAVPKYFVYKDPKVEGCNSDTLNLSNIVLEVSNLLLMILVNNLKWSVCKLCWVVCMGAMKKWYELSAGKFGTGQMILSQPDPDMYGESYRDILGEVLKIFNFDKNTSTMLIKYLHDHLIQEEPKKIDRA